MREVLIGYASLITMKSAFPSMKRQTEIVGNARRIRTNIHFIAEEAEADYQAKLKEKQVYTDVSNSC